MADEHMFLFRPGRKAFFFEEKKQKLLDIGTRASQSPKPNEQKFLVLFFKKELLAFFARVGLKANWY